MAFKQAQHSAPRRVRPASQQPLDQLVPRPSACSNHDRAVDQAAADSDAEPDAALLLDCGLLRRAAHWDAARRPTQPNAPQLIHDLGGVS
jgi:hypothetical protein